MTKTRELADLGGGFIPAGTGAQQRTVESKLQDVVSVLDFIPETEHAAIKAGTSFYDCAPGFQAAINSLGENGGSVKVPPGRYEIDSGITANAGVLLYGETKADISNNTNGSAAARPIIVWSGRAPVDGTMFIIQPSTVGDIVFGGGCENIEWNGLNTASIAVHLDNTKFSKFVGKVRNVKTAGVVVSSESGSASNFSQRNTIDLNFTWGTQAAVQGAHGLLIKGNGSTAPGTQQHVTAVTGLVYNGSLVRVEENDNCQFYFIQGVVQAGGTGNVLSIINTGSQGSNNNVFFYVNGDIQIDNGLKGNRFIHFNSEGAGISQITGTSTWQGYLLDYVTGKTYNSPTYTLADKLSISPGNFVQNSASGAVYKEKMALQWDTFALSELEDCDVNVIIPAPAKYANGVLTKVVFLLGTNGTSGGDYRLQFKTTTGQTQALVVNPEVDQFITVAAGAQYTPTEFTYTYATPLSYSTDDYIFIRLRRTPLDALDTNTDPLLILGAHLYYTSDGPDSAGSGPFTIPSYF